MHPHVDNMRYQTADNPRIGLCSEYGPQRDILRLGSQHHDTLWATCDRRQIGKSPTSARDSARIPAGRRPAFRVRDRGEDSTHPDGRNMPWISCWKRDEKILAPHDVLRQLHLQSVGQHSPYTPVKAFPIIYLGRLVTVRLFHHFSSNSCSLTFCLGSNLLPEAPTLHLLCRHLSI